MSEQRLVRLSTTADVNDDDAHNPYSESTVSTVTRNRPCGCRIGLLSDIKRDLPQARHCGTLGNPWIIIPCEKHL